MGFNEVEYDTFYAYTNWSDFGFDFDTVRVERKRLRDRKYFTTLLA